jgi:hypothetical protein
MIARIVERIRRVGAGKPQAAARIAMAAKQGLGIDVDTADSGREVQRGASPVPAGETDHLTTGNTGARAGQRPGEKGIRGLQPAVVDRDRAVPHHRPGEGDDPAVGGSYLGSGADREVNAPVSGKTAQRSKRLHDGTAGWWL